MLKHRFMQTQLRKIGNSVGVIIPKKILEESNVGTDVEIRLSGNEIVITRAKPRPNLDRSTWGKQYKDAIKAGHKPEKAIFGNRLSPAEEKEITWPPIK